ncbi:MAG: hypothetical protein HC902_03470 [Calothrix sp. SM1_5_4]|nr:hypothetical protein [Calothrix sp. SM1_5_4]
MVAQTFAAENIYKVGPVVAAAVRSLHRRQPFKQGFKLHGVTPAGQP